MRITQITDHSPTPKLPFKILEAQGAESCWNMLEPIETTAQCPRMSSFSMKISEMRRSLTESEKLTNATVAVVPLVSVSKSCCLSVHKEEKERIGHLCRTPPTHPKRHP